MNNRIMWRIDNNDTLVIFPENRIKGVSQGRNHEGRFDIYNARTKKRENLPSNIKKVKTEGKLIFHGSLAQMFAYSKADEIDLSGFDTSNVTDMYCMFYDSQAQSLDLSNFDTSNVTNMSSMFYGSQIKTLYLSSFDTSKVTDMSSMFWRCQATYLDLSSFDTRNVTNMAYMFAYSRVRELDLTSFSMSEKTDITYIFRDTPNTKVLVNEQFAEQIKESTIE